MGLISVIVPVYNIAQYLDRCLQSIVSQSYQELEIIIVDDGSTDGSFELCDCWKEKDSRIRVIHKENEGVSVARNLGLSMAQGEYISFVDGDDWLAVDMYEKMISEIVAMQADVAICAPFYVTEPSKVTIEKVLEGTACKSGIETLKSIFTKNDTRVLAAIWNKLFKKEIIEGIEFPVGRVCAEDLLFTTKVLLKCKRCALINAQLYYYDMSRSDSIMRSSKTAKKILDEIEIKKECSNLVQTANDKELENLCDDSFLQLLLFRYVEIASLQFKGKEECLGYIKSSLREMKIGAGKSVETKMRHLLFLCSPRVYIFVYELFRRKR